MRGYVELFNLGKTYETPKGPAVIVENFNLNIHEGEFISLLGHSGCGKSTVLTMLAGLNAITDGGIVVAGREIMGPGPDRGVVFQSPCLLPWMSACTICSGKTSCRRQDCLRVVACRFSITEKKFCPQSGISLISRSGKLARSAGS